ncbi:phage minor head protein [Desulfovibrio inopinatus]|uniref:phage head morphogenesis protein n=1 Tax=Desulfovibrio inopinatus TaxID=102109 RepID=UPI00040E3BA5|nr:phage minor head protein [Desulfovibrio inopinatus]
MDEKPLFTLPFDLPPADAIDYFRSKGNAISFGWQDMWRDAHSKTFTVAKAMKMDILQDIRTALDTALSEGNTFEQFRKELEPLLRQKGWWGKKKMIDPLTGEEKLVQLGSPWRLKTIYHTNISTAYAAGHYKRMMETAEARPLWLYDAILDSRTRPMHKTWDGKVLPYDHPWWRTHYPPNGWRCRCGVIAMSEAEAARDGFTISPDPPEQIEPWRDPRTGEVHQVPKGIDPGWDYNPGAAWLPKIDDKLIQGISTLPAPIGQQAVQELVDSDAFDWFHKKPNGVFPVMRLREDVAQAIGAIPRVAVISDQSMSKNINHHPELTVAEYRFLPEIGASPDIIIQDGAKTVALIKKGEVWYHAACKATATGKAVFVTSYRRTVAADVERVLRRGKILFEKE